MTWAASISPPPPPRSVAERARRRARPAPPASRRSRPHRRCRRRRRSTASSTATRGDVAERQRRAALLAGDARRASASRRAPVGEQRRGRLASRASSNAAASRTAIEPRSACSESALRSARAALLAVDLEGVVARIRAEDDAAAGEVRRARRAGAGAARALLAPGLASCRRRPGRGSWSTAVPRRRAASSARTDSCTQRPVEAGAEGGVVERDRLRAAPPSTGASAIGAHLDDSRCAGRGRSP